MPENLKNQTVVVTGATSGIGRASALAFAKEGARLVLAARGPEALDEVCRECRELGAEAISVPTDVTEMDQVRHLAEAAASAFQGKIDIWVNDPGVGAVGAFEGVPMESHEQVIRTNLLGYMHGVYGVLPYLKRQGKGVIINLNSLGAFLPSPYAAAYTASKFGLKGFSEAIRGEVRNFPEIQVCELFPGFVDSPGVSHGANYVGVELKPVPPAISTLKVARVVVDLAKNPRPTTMLGSSARLARAFYALAPVLAVNGLARFMESHFQRGRPAARTDGILFEPSSADSGIKGDYDYSRQRNVALGVFLPVAGMLTWFLMSRKHQSQ